MRKFMAVAFLLFIAIAGWRVGEALSTDALGMALGVIFGMMAGIPAALIALSANRMGQSSRQTVEPHPPHALATYGQQPYPPVIIVAGHPNGQGQHLPPPQAQYSYPPLHAPRLERRFTVVGEE